MLEILDFRLRLRTPETLKAWAPNPIPGFRRYVELYKMKPRLTFQAIEETIEEMREAGITKGVVCGSDGGENEIIHKICKDYPDYFIGIAGARPDRDVMQAYRDLKRAFEEYDLKGLSLGPYLMGIAADHHRNYPLYALCCDLKKVVIIHSSSHYNVHTPLELGNPICFDRVAVDFPDLRMVMSHAGVGFGVTALVIAQRHPNVYLEFSALYPKYIEQPFIRALNSYLKDKGIFGTDYPLVPFSLVDEWKAVIKESNWSKFFCQNGLKALGMEK